MATVYSPLSLPQLCQSCMAKQSLHSVATQCSFILSPEWDVLANALSFTCHVTSCKDSYFTHFTTHGNKQCNWWCFLHAVASIVRQNLTILFRFTVLFRTIVLYQTLFKHRKRQGYHLSRQFAFMWCCHCFNFR